MGFVFDFLQGVAKAIPVLISKIVSVLLIIFTIGLFFGYGIAFFGFSPYYLLIPVAALIVMWYKLDEGTLLLILLAILATYYPIF